MARPRPERCARNQSVVHGIEMDVIDQALHVLFATAGVVPMQTKPDFMRPAPVTFDVMRRWARSMPRECLGKRTAGHRRLRFCATRATECVQVVRQHDEGIDTEAMQALDFTQRRAKRADVTRQQRAARISKCAGDEARAPSTARCLEDGGHGASSWVSLALGSTECRRGV